MYYLLQNIHKKSLNFAFKTASLKSNFLEDITLQILPDAIAQIKLQRNKFLLLSEWIVIRGKFKLATFHKTLVLETYVLYYVFVMHTHIYSSSQRFQGFC